jgi:diketogulonate reductase-like aldo/keto reductase
MEMPWLGLGTFELEEGGEVENSVRWALDYGYRSIDTATAYDNEEGVAHGIRQSSVQREDVFLTTKVWNTDQGYDSTLAALKKSLRRLDTDYVDLYLVHWPVKGKTEETWRALEDLYEAGQARAIGVSNFLIRHLEDLLQSARVMPALNQVEFHPRLPQPELHAFCDEHDIRLQAWRPLMKGQVLEIPELIHLGEKHGKSPIQVTLRWMLQKRVLSLARSSQKEHIEHNADVFDFELDPDEVAIIDGLDRSKRLGPHPDEFTASP